MPTGHCRSSVEDLIKSTRKPSRSVSNLLLPIQVINRPVKENILYPRVSPQIAWALNKGIKSELKQYWDVELGVTYIPWSKIREVQLEELKEGGILDVETLAPGKEKMCNFIEYHCVDEWILNCVHLFQSGLR